MLNPHKIKVYGLNARKIPKGWVFDDAGTPVTDPEIALDILYRTKKGGLTPLGGTLSGASFSPIRVRTQKSSDPDRLGHLFLAIDPKAFRPEGAFEDDLDAVIDVLHETPPLDPAQPVLVPGDPEAASRARRLAEGIPIPESLREKIRKLCESSGVPCILE